MARRRPRPRAYPTGVSTAAAAPSTPPLESPFAVRHRSAREAVVASQRGRMLEAMVRVAAAKGYAGATIGDVVAAAGVSRRTFYEQFRDKEDCFLAAFDVGLRFIRARIEEEIVRCEATDWRSRVRVVIETYLTTLAAEPDSAKVVHLETLAAGERVRARWNDVFRRSLQMFRALQEVARADDPRIPVVSDAVLLALLGGLPELVRDYVRDGRTAELPALAPELSAMAIAILAGVGTDAALRAPAASKRTSSGRR